MKIVKSYLISWCNECGKNDVPLVELGETPDYESATACICRECLKKALELIP